VHHLGVDEVFLRVLISGIYIMDPPCEWNLWRHKYIFCSTSRTHF